MIGFRIRQVLKMLSQNVLLPLAYASGRFRPCDRRLAVFADAHHSSRPESMDRLFEEMSAQAGEFRIVEWYRNFSEMGMAAQLLASLSFMRLYASAGTVILCDNFLPVSSCRKRKETTVVQLWHGPGAFKKFGYDAPEDIPPYYRGHVYRNYDLVTVSGPACVRPFSSAMRLKRGVAQPVGISRMDNCVSDSWRETCRREFAENYPEAAGKKVLLWAPTFRGNAGDPSVKGLEEMRRLREELGGEWTVIFSLHPHLRGKISGEDGFARMPSERILPSADLFVTDYSSLLYDACLQGCRMLMFAPDLGQFMESRGTYMRPEEFPGQIVTEADKLPEAVKTAMREPDEDRRRKFEERWLGACDGHATGRILAFIRKRRDRKF